MRKRCNSSSSSSGVGITTVVQVVLATLKIVGLIDWSWGIVLIPLWIELALMMIAIIYLLICHRCENTK